MKYDTLQEIVAATHLSQFVSSSFESRGGIFLVAPPASFKTTLVDTLDCFRATVVISDINVQTLVQLKEHFTSYRIRTICFSDYEKLYKRNPSVASNIEGIIMSLAEEGFRKASFQPQFSSAIPARCTITGGMTVGFYEHKIARWTENGFARRFMFPRYSVNNIEILEQAILQNRYAKLGSKFNPLMPSAGTKIPYSVSQKQIKMIETITRHVQYRNSTMILLQKIMSVLKWKFDEKRANEILDDFAPCLSKDGGVLELSEEK